MSGELDAMGDLALAGAAARALDAPHPAARHGETRCANCGAALAGDFCHACGQRAHLHRSLADVGHELLHGITHFDSKTWRTLPMLVFRPGKLTRDYVMGQRARYIGPVPMFLLTVFLMFLLFGFVPISLGDKGNIEKAMTVAEAQAALPDLQAKLAELDAELERERAAGNSGAVAALVLTRQGLAKGLAQVEARSRGEDAAPLDLPDAIAGAIRGGDVQVNLGAVDVSAEVSKALKNPDLILYKIKTKAYKLSFLLVPLSLPWLWLVFAWRRDIHVYDHAVFALYSISFMTIVFMVVVLGGAMGIASGRFNAAMLLLVPLVHMFVQLKGAYALSNGSALWRTGVLATGALVSLSLYLSLMLVLGILD
jgi:hypothetical protein